MEKIQRVGVSIETELLMRFDRMIGEQGYANRSEAVRDLIRDKLSTQRLLCPDVQAVGAVFLVYDHHKARLAQRLIKLQHDRILETICTMHVHLDHHNCMEVILLRGRVSRINKLADSLVSLRGVRLGRVELINPGE